jgi:hypothetical protein
VKGSHVRGAAAALGLYLLVSFLFFGVRVVDDLGSRSIGIGEDPSLFMWALKWWPQSVMEAWSPLHTDLIYVPKGFDMTWATGIPGPSAVLAPITQTAGPIFAYNVLLLLIPALNGWAAFLLCRSLGARYWPSVLGGYLFGFSSYVIAQTLGHVHLSLVVCVPLAFYLVIRRFRGTISPRAFVALLTATLAFQFLTSTEVFLTLTMFGAVIGLLAVAGLPQRRPEIWASAKQVLLAYVLTGVLVSPYLISALSNADTLPAVHPYSADLVNLVIPTEMTAVGGEALDSVSSRFDAGLEEEGAYLGLPLILIAGLFWWERRDRYATILLLAALVALVASLGPRLEVLGAETWLRLPWLPFTHMPVVEYVIPIRLIVYTWLVIAVVAALWLSRGGTARWALAVVAVVSVLPNFFVTVPGTQQFTLASGEESPWDWPRPVPQFFRDPEQRAILDGRGAALVLPYHFRGGSMLWQAEANMSFSMAGGYISVHPPEEYECWPAFRSLVAEDFRPDQQDDFIAFLRAKGAGAVVVEESYVETARPLLNALHGPVRTLGGVRVYLLGEGFSRDATAHCPPE